MDKPDASGPAPPIQPSSKSTAAAPMLNSEMELGSFAGQGQAPAAQAAENDIMQIARIGDIPAMERLFEAGTYDATYADDEGITPLHVSPPGTLDNLTRLPRDTPSRPPSTPH